MTFLKLIGKLMTQSGSHASLVKQELHGVAASANLIGMTVAAVGETLAVRSGSSLYEVEEIDLSASFDADDVLEASLGFRLLLRRSSVIEGQTCLIVTENEALAVAVDSIDAPEENGFANVYFDASLGLGVQERRALVPAFDVSLNQFVLHPILEQDPSKGAMHLDGIYSGLVAGDFVMLVSALGRVVAKAESVTVSFEKKNDPVLADMTNPHTFVRLDRKLPDGWTGRSDTQVLFEFVDAGTLYPRTATTVATTTLTQTGILATLQSNTPFDPSAPFVLVDADGQALEATASPVPNQPTKVLLKANPAKLGSITELRFPITAYTNLSRATRGETVRNEVLGSGNSAIPFQTFTLAKKPLTYLADETGKHNTLEVYVNGQKWRQATSFYGAKPTDQIYVVSHDEDHQTIITFGDGELGMRVPTGSNNVVADYRFGVGGNVPANSITTLKRPIKGVRKIFNPLPATGGKEPPTAEELRREAPLRTLVLGRLISLADFEAEARLWGNVLAAKAEWGWDALGENPVVKIHFVVPDAGDPSNSLRAYLAALAALGTLLEVIKAVAKPQVGAVGAPPHDSSGSSAALRHGSDHSTDTRRLSA